MEMNSQIEGMNDLQKAFSELKFREQRAVLSKAFRAGGNVILKAAKALVEVRTGRLKKALGVKTSIKRGEATVLVGNTKKGGAHAHLVERGTGPRRQKDGRYTGQMPARPFLRPAFDESQDEVLKAITANLRPAIEKIASKRGRA